MSRALRAWWPVALVLTFAVARMAAAAPLVADLSSREIAISTGFAGAELLLFGAVDGEGDIVVVVRGPKRREVVRRKTRIAGIWVNGKSMTFEDVPAFYWVASTRPIEDIAPARVLEAGRIGATRLDLAAAAGTTGDIDSFRTALLRTKRRVGLYNSTGGQVRFIGDRLFRTMVRFPATVPTGQYSVEVYLLRGGRMVGQQLTSLAIRRVGAEADIFNFAHQNAALYGIICVVIALAAGWLAGVVFRKA